MPDNVDEWDRRIEQTGCYEENEKLQICRYDTGDWRKCLGEMRAFRDCWHAHNNARCVQTVDAQTHDDLTADLNLTGEKHDR